MVSKRTDAGKRKHLITIWQMVGSSPPTFDASGASLGRSDVLKTSAAIAASQASDATQGGQTTAQIELTLNIRYRSEVRAGMRVDAPHGTYIIRAVDNVEQQDEELNLHCIALGLNQ